ncbi:phage terminase small subunit P27 family [Neomegalonema sp.]|uniref:phage terminase small subunit P27 family n=1 Tax=Neomegalonema sp. TaxID=2039713 RepID=UPI0026287D8A|nr:phage terminase small subunit P27 family [Neomegalonema sp.]MDD2870227.1 phage terminase small subunit P27 family [Neomegalonema sp.]
MKGRKPSPEKVVPLRRGGETRSLDERAADEAAARKPFNLTADEAALWDEIAPELAKLGRLKAIFVHAVHEYVAALARLRAYRAELREDGETYEVKGRNGDQQKSVPAVAQYNESWRQWRALAAELGLTPASERGLGGAVRDLFDDPADEFLG